MSNLIYTEPKEYITVNTINSISISITGLELNKFVDLTVFLVDNKTGVFKTINYRIRDDEYMAWSNDDEYLTNIVLSRLGLTRTAPPAIIVDTVSIADANNAIVNSIMNANNSQ